MIQRSLALQDGERNRKDAAAGLTVLLPLAQAYTPEVEGVG